VGGTCGLSAAREAPRRQHRRLLPQATPRFGADFVEHDGQPVKARFEVNGDVVTVHADNEAMRFRVSDSNRIVMDPGGLDLPLSRVR